MADNLHNPDVLSCLANLSNDEVFTPPSVVNQMLDMLPQELFRSGKTTFLDIGCKSGVFLREITKRLIAGLADEMPDLQTRVDHILHKQVFGIATTELTSLVSRRTLYCSKYPNCRYSTSPFKTVEGNIRFRNIAHTFVNGRCKWCGASEDQFGPKVRKGLETHAYEFIHTDHPEEIFKMKFDVIVGNPPYQLADGGNNASAMPIYQKFVTQAKKLDPRYLTMIIPARWYSGGRGLDDFRNTMLSDKRMRYLVDFPDSEECFPGVDIAGGVCYFLWDRGHQGLCTVKSVCGGKEYISERRLDEYQTFIRSSEALSIVSKVKSVETVFMDSVVSSQKPFGLRTYVKPTKSGDVQLRYGGGLGPFRRKEVVAGREWIDQYKVIMSYLTYDHAGRPDKDGKRRIFSTMEVIGPGVVCTETYLVVSAMKRKCEAVNLFGYLKTMFVRFLVSQVAATQHISKASFAFVPLQDFSKPWTDAELYKKYKLTKDEIAFIESMIKPME